MNCEGLMILNVSSIVFSFLHKINRLFFSVLCGGKNHKKLFQFKNSWGFIEEGKN